MQKISYNLEGIKHRQLLTPCNYFEERSIIIGRVLKIEAAVMWMFAKKKFRDIFSVVYGRMKRVEMISNLLSNPGPHESMLASWFRVHTGELIVTANFNIFKLQYFLEELKLFSIMSADL